MPQPGARRSGWAFGCFSQLPSGVSRCRRAPHPTGERLVTQQVRLCPEVTPVALRNGLRRASRGRAGSFSQSGLTTNTLSQETLKSQCPTQETCLKLQPEPERPQRPPYPTPNPSPPPLHTHTHIRPLQSCPACRPSARHDPGKSPSPREVFSSGDNRGSHMAPGSCPTCPTWLVCRVSPGNWPGPLCERHF